MVPGHTKFKCDGSFGLVKRLYRKTTVDCVDHVVDVVKRSSIAGLNKAQRYNGDEGFQYYDFVSSLETYFKNYLACKSFSIFFLLVLSLEWSRLRKLLMVHLKNFCY